MKRSHNLIQIKGGSNCDVYLYGTFGKQAIIKIFGNSSVDKQTKELILRDYFEIKNKLTRLGIKVPITRNVYATGDKNADIVIIESYDGVSLREILNNSKISTKIKCKYVRACIELTTKFPEDVPIDTNPGNFVFNKDSVISFVDFEPPYPWKYESKPKIQSKLIKIFPSLNASFYKDKRVSYYENVFRIKRLLFHCKNICKEIEKFL